MWQALFRIWWVLWFTLVAAVGPQSLADTAGFEEEEVAEDSVAHLLPPTAHTVM